MGSPDEGGGNRRGDSGTGLWPPMRAATDREDDWLALSRLTLVSCPGCTVLTALEARTASELAETTGTGSSAPAPSLQGACQAFVDVRYSSHNGCGSGVEATRANGEREVGLLRTACSRSWYMIHSCAAEMRGALGGAHRPCNTASKLRSSPAPRKTRASCVTAEVRCGLSTKACVHH